MARSVLVFALALGVLFAPAIAFAADPAPRTAGDPAVDTNALELLLKPLRKAQLGAEAEAWAGHLEKKAQAISQAQIQATRAEGEAKEALLGDVEKLMEERSGLVKRLTLVLGAWEEKGGDPAELRTYVDTVTGLDLGLVDASSALSFATKWITSPEGGIKLGKNILWFVLIIFIARIVSNLIGAVVRRGLTAFEGTPELLRNFLSNTVRNVIFVIGVVVALAKLGLDIGPLLAAIGAAGLVIGFALQDTLSNFASGVMILLYRPYNLGDVVGVAGITGKVETMTLVSTTIKTPDNQVLVVPNSRIWGGVITNVTGSETRRVDMVFGIGYEDDVDKAKAILTKILEKDERVLKDPAPVVAMAALADSSVNFNVRPWAKTGDYWGVLADVTEEVKKSFDAEGISIPFPQTDVHIHQVQPD